jgi:hypothetical protein
MLHTPPLLQSLESVLHTFGLLPASRYGAGPATLPEAYPQVEATFKIMWADHGDVVSTQYAGVCSCVCVCVFVRVHEHMQV